MYVFFVMDYCPCGDLGKVLEKEPNQKFTEQLARLYIVEVVLAIEYLHEK